MELSDAYRLLEVEPGATASEIREAYLIAVKVWHPDRFASDEKLKARAQEKLKTINEAYRLISRAPLRTTTTFTGPPPNEQQQDHGMNGPGTRSAEPRSGPPGGLSPSPSPNSAGSPASEAHRKRAGWSLIGCGALISALSLAVSLMRSCQQYDYASRHEPPADSRAPQPSPSSAGGILPTDTMTNAGSLGLDLRKVPFSWTIDASGLVTVRAYNGTNWLIRQLDAEFLDPDSTGTLALRYRMNLARSGETTGASERACDDIENTAHLPPHRVGVFTGMLRGSGTRRMRLVAAAGCEVAMDGARRDALPAEVTTALQVDWTRADPITVNVHNNSAAVIHEVLIEVTDPADRPTRLRYAMRFQAGSDDAGSCGYHWGSDLAPYRTGPGLAPHKVGQFVATPLRVPTDREARIGIVAAYGCLLP